MTAIVSALILAWTLAAPAAPPDTLTLEQAIAEALKAEPELRAARAELEATRGDAQQAARRPNPDVSFEQREQAGGADRQTAIAVELPLDLFRRGPRMTAAARSVDRADAMVGDRERLLAAAVRERYGDALLAARRLEVMDALLAAARRTHELLTGRVTEGAAPPLDRDLSLVELRRLEGERELAAGRVATALAALKILLGREPSADVALADSLEHLTVAAAVPPRDDVRADRADVREAIAAAAIARAGTDAALQERRPELSVFGGYMRMAESFPQSGLSPLGLPEPIGGVFHNVSAGIKVSVPLFNRGQGAIAAARAREDAAGQTLAARRLAAAGENDAARKRLEAARRALAAYAGETRALARRNLDVVRETYTLGRATLFDVLSEQRRYSEFEAAYTDALAETLAALTDLQRAKGAGQ